MPDSSSGTGVSLEIFDFNRIAIQHSRSANNVPSAPPLPDGKSILPQPVSTLAVMHRRIVEHDEIVGPNEFFTEAVTTSLPYVLTTTSWPFDLSYRNLPRPEIDHDSRQTRFLPQRLGQLTSVQKSKKVLVKDSKLMEF